MSTPLRDFKQESGGGEGQCDHPSINTEEIKTLLELLSAHDVTEFKVEHEGRKLWLKRGPQVVHSAIAPGIQPAFTAPPAMHVIQGTGPGAASEPTASPAMGEAAQPKRSESYYEIRSPMVGTFYRKPAVDAPPYVDVGDVIKKGDVLCIVEAMKLMNEIESEVSGKVVQVCLQDGQMAEYGEVLFRIEQSS